MAQVDPNSVTANGTGPSSSDSNDAIGPRLPRENELEDGPPGDLWLDIFSKSKPTPAAVRSRVRSLNKAGRHDHVCALIEAALINGQSQPWMYEILALSMELERRPRKEVERVVLSMSDFGTANYDSMVQSARYLISFERPKAALTLLKQAAGMDPDRLEAFLSAMPLVQSTMDAEAARWVLPGAVANLWGKETKMSKQRAFSLARQIARSLQKAGEEASAEELVKLVEAAAIPDIHAKLEWDGECDLDLHIAEPMGHRCTHASSLTPVGGRLLEDGFGPVDPIEEYVCARGVSGDYLIEIQRRVGHPVSNRCRLTVAVRQANGEVKTTKRSFDVTAAIEPVRVTLADGRRTAPQRVLQMPARQPRARLRVAADEAPQRGGAIGLTTQIGVVNEGAQLSGTPVVSPDRRYVRIGLQPWFRNVTDIETFRLTGPQQ